MTLYFYLSSKVSTKVMVVGDMSLRHQWYINGAEIVPTISSGIPSKCDISETVGADKVTQYWYIRLTRFYTFFEIACSHHPIYCILGR